MDSSLLVPLALILLVCALFASLLMVPLGLPGLWVMLGSGLVYNLVVKGSGIGTGTIVGVGVLVVIAEVIEFWLSSRYARKYGGSRRASWGAIIGGIVGAIVGVPVPVIGSVIGAFAGSFVGALVGELTVPRESRGDVTRVATGALIGRAVAAAAKTGIGVVVAVWLVAAAVFFRG